jgi:hypothetical protein
MNSDAKSALERWTKDLDDEPEVHDRAFQAFLAALGAVHLPPDAKPKVLTYLQGRAFRAEYQPRF